MRWVLHAALLFLLFGGLRCETSSEIGNDASDPTDRGADSLAVYVVSHGWHAGIALRPRGALRDLGLLRRIDPRAEWLELGWGDASYYPSPDPGLGTTLKAGLWPTGSVMHVVALRQHPAERFTRSEIVRFDLEPAARSRLEEALAADFDRTEEGALRPLEPGLYARSRFYAARGRYHALNNSNHWNARTLRAAGLPVEVSRALTEEQLMEQVRAAGTVVRRVRND